MAVFGDPQLDRYPFRLDDVPYGLLAQSARGTELPSPSTPTEPTASAAVSEKMLSSLFPEVDWVFFDEGVTILKQALVAAYLLEGEPPSTDVLLECLSKSGLVLLPADLAKTASATLPIEASGSRPSSATSSDTPASGSLSPSKGGVLVYDRT